MRNAIVAFGVAAAIVVYLVAAAGNRREIAKVRAEAQAITVERDSLVAAVEAREAERAGLAEQAGSFEAEAKHLRDSVDVLERDRSAAQLDVREIRTVGALQ